MIGMPLTAREQVQADQATLYTQDAPFYVEGHWTQPGSVVGPSSDAPAFGTALHEAAEADSELPAAAEGFARDVSPPGVWETCDVCAAAKLAESGVMPSRVTPAELHAKCRYPGTCECGCEYALGVRCANCRRNRSDDYVATPEGTFVCLDVSDCAQAMLSLPPAPRAPRASAEKSLTPRAPQTTTPKAIRPAREKAARIQLPCKCGCGEVTGGGLYRPGHDARHVKKLWENIRGGSDTLETALAELPSDALRGKLRKQAGAGG